MAGWMDGWMAWRLEGQVGCVCFAVEVEVQALGQCTPPHFITHQITTCKGIVMGRLRSQQRQREVELMHYCFNKLGAWCVRGSVFIYMLLRAVANHPEPLIPSHLQHPSNATTITSCQPIHSPKHHHHHHHHHHHPGLAIIGEVDAPGFLEGGDFIAMGRDLALVGIGLRRWVGGDDVVQ